MTIQNKSKLKSFSLSKKYSIQPLLTKDIVIIEHLRNGKSRRKEINYGTSFFSQSSRNVWVSKNLKSLEIIRLSRTQEKFDAVIQPLQN